MDSSEINFRFSEEELEIVSIVQSEDKTGVEMEAMTAASVASLTVYDMCRAASHEICITDLQLESKTGGRRDYTKAE